MVIDRLQVLTGYWPETSIPDHMALTQGASWHGSWLTLKQARKRGRESKQDWRHSLSVTQPQEWQLISFAGLYLSEVSLRAQSTLKGKILHRSREVRGKIFRNQLRCCLLPAVLKETKSLPKEMRNDWLGEDGTEELKGKEVTWAMMKACNAVCPERWRYCCQDIEQAHWKGSYVLLWEVWSCSLSQEKSPLEAFV